MRTPKILRLMPVGVAALLAVPLPSDGGLPCDNTTTSLTSQLNNPIAGDEKFFTLPIGPSNVMFLLDTSGSMANVPQCGDATDWGDSAALATCKWPTFANLTNPAAGAYKVDGTCTATAAVNPDLNWMNGYSAAALLAAGKPVPVLADVGRGAASNGLVDYPPWGAADATHTCTGDACMFTRGQVYEYGNWTETTAARITNPCTLTVNYYDSTCSGNTVVNGTLKTLTIPLPNCSTCLDPGTAVPATAPGFYFFTYKFTHKYAYRQGGSCIYNSAYTETINKAYMNGAWLNANPPKFVSARKVIKDIAWIDPAKTATTDQLRLGLTFFSSNIGNNAEIIVPVGPSEANSYPVNVPKYVEARQVLFDALNHTHSPTLMTPAATGANGQAGWPTGINLPSMMNGGTPMATALFHLGQYFTQANTYTTAFGNSSYEPAAFAQTSSGTMKANWVDATNTTTFCWTCQKAAIVLVTDGSPNSEMTFPSAITGYDQNVYTLATNCGAGTSCPTSGCCSPTDSSAPSRLPRVAAWLHEHDLVPSKLNGNQLLSVSAVSFNLASTNKAQTILQATANMGGGMYNNAADGTALAAAVAQAVAQVSTTANSFSAPAATALTTINAVDTKAFITRFKPNAKSTWEGHLYQWMLFDEAAAGCDPTKTPEQSASDPTQQVTCRGKQVMANFDGEATSAGFNVCNKSFLVDADCDEVIEDSATGKWFKKGTSNQAAHMLWDAGEALSNSAFVSSGNAAAGAGYRTAAEHADNGNIAPYTQYAPGKTPRNLWTVLPNGTMLELETKNADALKDYMNLDVTWCSQFESLAKLCGTSPLPTCPVTIGTEWKRYCAQQVILFARGWDVMDQDGDGCAGPGYGISPPSGVQPNPNNGTSATSNTGWNGTPFVATTNTVTKSCAITSSGTNYYTGEERDRLNDAKAAGIQHADGSQELPAPTFYKLGDIFHSAPVLVHPPTPEGMCKLGMDNQCVRTLFGYTSNDNYTLAKGYQTALEQYPSCSGSGRVDAYRAWRNAYAARQNATLVGANDGFLHAFDAGGPDTTTGERDLDCTWPNVTDGTGVELWGLLPPDLLPRLRDTVLNHQYMVDGNVMVRDVWVDGAPADSSTNNPVSASGNSLDGVKQKNEFRTVAILSERSGGTQFTALDVTNAFSTTPADRPRPTFKWSFPPPRSADAQLMAQSWVDFSPRPPPIGPVRLAPASGEQATGAGTSPSGAAQSFVEKWVVMLNGGYDPTLTRGRAVWMLDAWSGSVYWRYTDASFKTNVVGAASNTTTSMFPVPAGIGMVDVGDPSNGTALDTDNFFDTATWGDLGGNLFVARFDQPGLRDATGLVTNWKAARTFEQGRTTTDVQNATNRNEFYYMTGNAFEPQRHQLRALLGAGNREQILEQGAGCGPDNLMSCCQAGCSVSTTSKLNYGVCNSTASFQCSSTGQMSTSPNFASTCGANAASCTAGAVSTACTTDANCATGYVCTGGTCTAVFQGMSTYTLNCGGTNATTAAGQAVCDANGLCTVTPVGTGHDLTPTAGTCSNKARYYGIWAYGGYTGTGGVVTAKTMSTVDTDWTTAQTFDQNRFTDVAGFTKAGVCTFTPDHTCSVVDTTQAVVDARGSLTCASGTKCQATIDDPGWFYTYNLTCPTAVTCDLATCTNEKTASGSAVVNNCVSWNSFLPKGSATSGSNPCLSAQTAQQSAIGYSSHFVSGVPTYACNQGIDPSTNKTYRGAARTTIAPPAAPMARNSVTRGGKVYYSTLQLDPGTPANSTGSGMGNIAAPLYWLENSRESHMCRHVSGSNCK